MTRAERIQASKEYLGQVLRMETRLSSILERRARYRERATQITARYGEQPGRAGSPGSKVERFALKIAALEAEMREIDAEFADTVRAAEEAIDAVPDPRYRDILTYRYLNGWSWSRIARGMSYSRDHVIRLHAGALAAFEPPGKPRI